MKAAITSFRHEYAFLSNFYLSPVELDGIVYPTAEHAYQAHKAIDRGLRQYIASAPTPGIAKRWGRSLPLRPGWDSIKDREMDHVIMAKFAPGTDLARRLLDTGDRELIEGNTWGDTYWGVCRGKGQNMLGLLLMAQRTNLRRGLPDGHTTG